VSTRRDKASLRVVLDAHALTGDGAQSGIGTYSRNLLRELGAAEGIEALATKDATLPPGVRKVRVQRFTTTRRRSVLEHAARVPVDLALRSRADVFHNPLFYAPPAIRRPWVQTLFDVIPLVDDDPALAVLRGWWKRFGPRYQRADAVIAISRHAADEGARLLDLKPERVHVIYLGVSANFRPDGDVVASEPPYLLVVSQFSRRKGFREAFEVIARLADAGYPHHLKIAGWVPDDVRPDLDALMAAASRPDRIELLGFVPDLPALIRGAAVLLVASRYEGFGLPAVEGMACGVPVVAFRNSSLTEIVEGGGVLVDDGDVVAMDDAVRGLLDSAEWRREVGGQGLERAKAFSWKTCAAATAEVYRAVADGEIGTASRH
jgi:glycosyltransferase involved in cell wall biosynthesis